ncbi:flavodoxin FldB [Thalassotalea sp. PS06]|uniref:flavodoxin FldB n=1 Tax=Thalassotalea sp. PS06 TaxID=2594005 RepID=UPI0011631CCB|nr:flavodoxin FldB [Thalassotalea sp. PS06]QDP00497.1 flavodoxin FldB [Thalassotalea sp. PS06]
MKIGLFYGSTTCYTEMAAEKIQATMGAELVEIFNIKDVALAECEAFDIIIFGISTWDFGELQEDWESSWDDIESLNLTDKVVALYGLGDQQGYGEWFQDALGMLHEQVILRGPAIIGYWPNQGYEFSASKALTEDQQYFVGLALDDECQYDLSEQRIDQWCQQILQEIIDLQA